MRLLPRCGVRNRCRHHPSSLTLRSSPRVLVRVCVCRMGGMDNLMRMMRDMGTMPGMPTGGAGTGGRGGGGGGMPSMDQMRKMMKGLGMG